MYILLILRVGEDIQFHSLMLVWTNTIERPQSFEFHQLFNTRLPSTASTEHIMLNSYVQWIMYGLSVVFKISILSFPVLKLLIVVSQFQIA